MYLHSDSLFNIVFPLSKNDNISRGNQVEPTTNQNIARAHHMSRRTILHKAISHHESFVGIKYRYFASAKKTLSVMPKYWLREGKMLAKIMITNFCGHYTYILKHYESCEMMHEMTQWKCFVADTPSVCDHLWSHVELFCETFHIRWSWSIWLKVPYYRALTLSSNASYPNCSPDVYLTPTPTLTPPRPTIPQNL